MLEGQSLNFIDFFILQQYCENSFQILKSNRIYKIVQCHTKAVFNNHILKHLNDWWPYALRLNHRHVDLLINEAAGHLKITAKISLHSPKGLGQFFPHYLLHRLPDILSVSFFQIFYEDQHSFWFGLENIVCLAGCMSLC